MVSTIGELVVPAPSDATLEMCESDSRLDVLGGESVEKSDETTVVDPISPMVVSTFGDSVVTDVVLSSGLFDVVDSTAGERLVVTVSIVVLWAIEVDGIVSVVEVDSSVCGTVESDVKETGFCSVDCSSSSVETEVEAAVELVVLADSDVGLVDAVGKREDGKNVVDSVNVLVVVSISVASSSLAVSGVNEGVGNSV